MRFLLLAAIVVVLAIIYLAVVLRLPSARSLLQTVLRVGWLWVAVVVVLGLIEAFRRWG